MRHMRLMIVASAGLCLTACGGNGEIRSAGSGAARAAATIADTVGMKPPVTTARTTADEKALSLSAKATSVAALASSAMARTGVIVKGSPFSQWLARKLDEARDLINAAATAREAGNAETYAEMVGKADLALDEIKAAVAKIGGL